MWDYRCYIIVNKLNRICNTSKTKHSKIFKSNYLDNTLKTVDDIEIFSLSVLGIIPSIGGDPGK